MISVGIPDSLDLMATRLLLTRDRSKENKDSNCKSSSDAEETEEHIVGDEDYPLWLKKYKPTRVMMIRKVQDYKSLSDNSSLG
ncbi:MAG: hypothetical protein GY820_35000 [Gammaproteobacteria bacterium]|nr:hypothetical protein [Gammaproteobacteria bacterium]